MESHADRTVLVAGASGLIGEAALRAFTARGWTTVGLSRSLPDDRAATRLLGVDLTDVASYRDTIGRLRGVTHVVYAALQEGAGLLPGWFEDDLIVRNATMLRNVFDALDTTALEHVSLLQGTKAYGVHHPSIGATRAPLPLRERAPRAEHPNFYWLQEDELRARQRASSWSLTIFRPTVVYGTWGHHNMNPLPAIAAYGALQQARGEPLHFPGTESVRTPRDAVDADLVARALVWAADADGAREATFNLTNGDVFCWESVWPDLAAAFGLPVGEQRPMSFARDLVARDHEWAELVGTHDLRVPATVAGMVGENSLVYADVVMAQPPAGPILNSTIAVRQAGFSDCIDTADMFVAQIRAMAAKRAIPPLPA